jgi:hypothetical protein
MWMNGQDTSATGQPKNKVELRACKTPTLWVAIVEPTGVLLERLHFLCRLLPILRPTSHSHRAFAHIKYVRMIFEEGLEAAKLCLEERFFFVGEVLAQLGQVHFAAAFPVSEN